MTSNPEPPDGLSHSIHVTAVSHAEELGYLGQQAISEAASPEVDYRIVGGHMVRLLLAVYPTRKAIQRTTVDADAALGDIEVIGPLSQRLQDRGFSKTGGNVFIKNQAAGKPIEINLLLSREDHKSGLQAQAVPGVGQVDSLPELALAMVSDPLNLDVTATLLQKNQQKLSYSTKVPDLEIDVIVKAHGWNEHKEPKDLSDLASLLEMRHAHPKVSWKLGQDSLHAYRKDTAVILHELASLVERKNSKLQTPEGLDRKGFAAPVKKHVSRPTGQ